MVPFAETDSGGSDGRIALWTFIAATLGAAASYAIKILREWVDDRRQQKEKGDAKIEGHYQALVARIDQEKRACEEEKREAEEESEEQSREILALTVRVAKALSQIRHLEFVLTTAKIPFEPYKDEDQANTNPGPSLLGDNSE
jgi:hypothetical protein